MKKNEIVILGLLLEKEMYGYEILNAIKMRHLDDWAKISTSSLYRALERLEHDGFVHVKREKVGKTPQRNIYDVTEKGKKRLAANLRKAIGKFYYNENPFGIALSFIYGLEPEEAISLLNRRLKKVEELIDHLKSVHKFIVNRIPLNWVFMTEGAVYGVYIERKIIKKMIKAYEDGSFNESIRRAIKYYKDNDQDLEKLWNEHRREYN